MSSEIVVKNSPYVLGIDLGTSNSAIAVFTDGEAKILPIDGEKTLPSVVNFREDGQIIVGRQARGRMMTDPENTVASVKREIGTNWEREFAGQPGKMYTPSDIQAEILTKLVTGAQQAGTIDLKGTPRLVVICCPANFDDAKKNATIEAGRLANLEVLRLLEEPVAAAIAYALDRATGVDQTILVYDLGGGTFDVSILQAISRGLEAPAEFRVLAKAGVPILGGDDFDRKIMEIAAAQFETISGIHILQDTKDWGISRKAIREAQQKLKEAAETAKRALTEAETALIELPNLIKDEAGNLHSLELEITREQFNDAIRDLILESKAAIEQALSEAKLTIDDISRIILVGGSTKVPLVKEMLTQMFGKEPYGDVDPDTVVARGAAIFGATLTMPENVEDAPPAITIYDIVTHHLGIEVAGGKFSRLIEKGLEIPADAPLTASKEYGTQRDNQTEIAIRVYQTATDIVPEYVTAEGVTSIGEFFITGIPPQPARQEHITITFEIDRQNLLKVRASSPSTTGELDIQRS